MKTRLFLAVLIGTGLTAANSWAQNSENPNPYAIFGSTPYIAGGTGQTPGGETVFVVTNAAPDSEIARMEHNPQTGKIKLFDKHGTLLAEKQLSQIEKAWISPDPKAEKYYSISPYAYCGNNPIRFIDPNGMEFTQAAWAWVLQLISQMQERQEYNDRQIAQKRAMLSVDGLSERLIAKHNRQIARLNRENQAFGEIRDEITTLQASDQFYDAKIDNTLSGPEGSTGYFGFDFATGTAEITMPNSTDISLFAHELKHAYQFEMGQLSVSYKKDGPKLFYDQTDEVEAYQRGSLFGQTAYNLNNLPDYYRALPVGPIDVTNHPKMQGTYMLSPEERPASFRYIADHQKNAFRADGTTYYYK